MTNGVEGKFYKLDNSYITQDEKIVVESWFQLPGNVMVYAFWAMAVFSVFYTIPLAYIIGIPIFINIITGFINWHFYKNRLIRILGLSLFHPFVTGAIGIGVGIFLFLRDELLLAGISIFTGIFGFLFLELSIFLYSLLARKYNLHPKYVFAKKRFGHVFPFENQEK